MNPLETSVRSHAAAKTDALGPARLAAVLLAWALLLLSLAIGGCKRESPAAQSETQGTVRILCPN